MLLTLTVSKAYLKLRPLIFFNFGDKRSSYPKRQEGIKILSFY
ncbi:hypothetical protein NEOC65_000087 [Neochlamydia sp. AcF65]|nr:hypothetical protein [Neochlamydia sp. AcF65]